MGTTFDRGCGGALHHKLERLVVSVVVVVVIVVVVPLSVSD